MAQHLQQTEQIPAFLLKEPPKPQALEPDEDDGKLDLPAFVSTKAQRERNQARLRENGYRWETLGKFAAAAAALLLVVCWYMLG